PDVPEQQLPLVERGEVLDDVGAHEGQPARLRQLRREPERVGIGLAAATELPRASAHEKLLARDVEGIEADAEVRDVTLAQLGVEQPPLAVPRVPPLEDLVIHVEARAEVAREAHAGAAGDSMVTGHRAEQHGEVAAATQDASL